MHSIFQSCLFELYIAIASRIPDRKEGYILTAGDTMQF